MQNPSSLSISARPKIDINFIYVDASYSSLKNEFTERFSGNQDAIDLLNAMESSPEFKSGKSSDDFIAFLTRIENADPNEPNISEDDSGTSWGHYQFTGGHLTCSKVLTSWDVVGSCLSACKLIAAALKTCKVARHLCFEYNIEAASYLSDIYLGNVVSILWDLWKSAGGPVCKGKERAVSSANDQITDPQRTDVAMRLTVGGEPNSNTPVVRNQDTSVANSDHDHISKSELEILLKNLVKEDLWTCIKANSITLPVPTKPRTKPDLISAVLQDPKAVTESFVASLRNLVVERKMRKNKPSSSRASKS